MIPLSKLGKPLQLLILLYHSHRQIPGQILDRTLFSSAYIFFRLAWDLPNFLKPILKPIQSSPLPGHVGHMGMMGQNTGHIQQWSTPVNPLHLAYNMAHQDNPANFWNNVKFWHDFLSFVNTGAPGQAPGMRVLFLLAREGGI